MNRTHFRTPIKIATLIACLYAAALFVGCSDQAAKKQSVARIGTHRIKVIPGCRTEETIGIRNEGVQPAFQFTCLNDEALRVVIVQDKELRVNGTSFGIIKEDDEITIRDGEVQVNGQKVGTLAGQKPS